MSDTSPSYSNTAPKSWGNPDASSSPFSAGQTSRLLEWCRPAWDQGRGAADVLPAFTEDPAPSSLAPSECPCRSQATGRPLPPHCHPALQQNSHPLVHPGLPCQKGCRQASGQRCTEGTRLALGAASCGCIRKCACLESLEERWVLPKRRPPSA